MYIISEETLNNAYKPYDIVTNNKGAVGFIQEVSLNRGQDEPKHQVNYSVRWLIGKDKHAWFYHEELTKHCNLFVEIAKASRHPFSGSDADVEEIMSKGI